MHTANQSPSALPLSLSESSVASARTCESATEFAVVLLLLETLDLLVDHQVRRLADLLAPPQRAVGFGLEMVVPLAQELALALATRVVALCLCEVAVLDRSEALLKARLLASALYCKRERV